MGFNTVVQQAVYTRLSGNISAGVYDDVPFLPEGTPRANFPFVTIGFGSMRPWDTDDTLGMSCDIALHVWSRAAGMKETRAVLDEIYVLLNRWEPTISGYNVVDLLHEYSVTMLEDDARTRHGVTNFRLTLQQTP